MWFLLEKLRLAKRLTIAETAIRRHEEAIKQNREATNKLSEEVIRLLAEDNGEGASP